MTPTTYLFVPGDRPERFPKAVASRAERVIIDLEDAVSDDQKSFARRQAREAVISDTSGKLVVRINALDTPWFEDDVQALAEACGVNGAGLAGVLIPKLETSCTVTLVEDAIGSTRGVALIGLIESAAGVANVHALASSGVHRLALGAIDLGVDIAVPNDSPLFTAVYAQLVIASRVAGLSTPIGSPPLTIHDATSITDGARWLKSMGVTAQLCIHPAQLDPIYRGFHPSQDEIDWAQRVLATEDASTQVDGQMVDKPVRLRAQSILDLAQRSLK